MWSAEPTKVCRGPAERLIDNLITARNKYYVKGDIIEDLAEAALPLSLLPSGQPMKPLKLLKDAPVTKK